MYKRISFFILSIFALLFMSTVNYDSQQSINKQLSAGSIFGLPSFLLSEPVAPITKAFNFSPAEMRAEVEASFPSLRSLKNLTFENQLERKLNTNPLWRSLIRNKRMSVGVVDMSDKEDVSCQFAQNRRIGRGPRRHRTWRTERVGGSQSRYAVDDC
jgi:beta-lactamase class A